MDIFNPFDGFPGSMKGAVVAIGNFDGVHRGHQVLLDVARDMARETGRPFAVLSFEPHPRCLFRPDDPPFRITPLPVKARRLEAEGVEALFIAPFDWTLASLSAEAFVATVLKERLEASRVVIGADFRFGQLRGGTPETIRAAGIETVTVGKAGDEAEDFSSTRVREALRQGEIEAANAVLGWEWVFEGTVFRGDRRGRELGYPTANVRMGETLHPAYGVYATLVQVVEDGPDAPWLPSATNIGIRPMFEVRVGQSETYIFDFDRDIYDKTLRVKPVRRLRGEARFEGLEALIVQIEKDCALAREILASEILARQI